MHPNQLTDLRQGLLAVLLIAAWGAAFSPGIATAQGGPFKMIETVSHRR